MNASVKPIETICNAPVALVNVKLRYGRYLVKANRIAAFTDTK